MKALVYVEHEGGEVKDATLAAVTAASKLGEVHALVAGSNVGDVAEAAAKIAGIGKVHVADAPHLDHGLAENVAPIAAKLMETSRRVRRSRHHHRQEHRPASRRTARRDADFRNPVGRGREHLHPPDLRRQRDRHGSLERRQESDHRPRHGVRESGARRWQRRRSSQSTPAAMPAPAASSASRLGERAARADQRQDHRLRRSRVRLHEQFHGLLEPLADKLGAASAQAARRSTPAMRPTTIRSARPARSSLPTSTSRSAFPARSSISRA